MPRILLVEDNPETCHAAAAVLQQARYEVDACPEPGAAFARVCQAAPDLVILDVPGDQRVGWQVLNQLKQQEETQAIPILLAVPTPGVLEADQQALAERGVRVLAHPIGPTDLIRGVEAVLGPPPPEPGAGRGVDGSPVREEDP